MEQLIVIFGIICIFIFPLQKIVPWVNYRQQDLQMTTTPNVNQTRTLWLLWCCVVNVTCYSGRQFVSVASHVCDEGYQPNATSSVRVCRDNGLWSGTIIACMWWVVDFAYGSVASCSSICVDAMLERCVAKWQLFLVSALCFISADNVQTTCSTCPSSKVVAAVAGIIALVFGVLAGFIAGVLNYHCIKQPPFTELQA